MRELSLHILDIVENSLAAGATLITVVVHDNRSAGRLTLRIEDNGRGVPPAVLENIFDPFVTSRTTRRVGLGLSLLREAALRCGGTCSVQSTEGKGTTVTAIFRTDSIDMPPWGDMSETMTGLIAAHPDASFVYRHSIDNRVFVFSTQQLEDEIKGLSMNHPEVLRYIAQEIKEGLASLDIAAPWGASDSSDS